jgi:hydrogenase expression/formation protein HypE
MTSQHHFEINETSLLVQEAVKSTCEILGFDPLHIANEGCFALFVPESDSEKALACLHRHQLGKQARIIGKVVNVHNKGMVTIETAMGVSRVLELFSGEQLPRIC